MALTPHGAPARRSGAKWATQPDRAGRAAPAAVADALAESDARQGRPRPAREAVAARHRRGTHEEEPCRGDGRRSVGNGQMRRDESASPTSAGSGADSGGREAGPSERSSETGGGETGGDGVGSGEESGGSKGGSDKGGSDMFLRIMVPADVRPLVRA